MPTKPKQSGFTLVEISIVLVIIAFIVGGVLVGRDLVKAAEVRSMVSDLEKYRTAINTFRLKYNALPGDMNNATAIWGTYAGCNWGENTADDKTCDGNGDGLIGAPTNADINNQAYTYEYYTFWQQLANAKLIQGRYTGGAQSVSWGYGQAEPSVNTPALKNAACVSVFRWNDVPTAGSAYYAVVYKTTFYVGLPLATDICYQPAFTPAEALSIDTKIDDGLPGSGAVVTVKPNWAPTANCATTTDPTTASYKTSSTTVNCNLLFPRISP